MSAAVVGTDVPAATSASTPAKALTCTLAVVLLVGATRWGSYIGSPPLFLTDALIGGAIVGRLMGPRAPRGQGPLRKGFRSTAPTLVVILLTYVILRMLLSGGYVLTADWFRDGAPYLYVVLALLSSSAVARSTPEARARTMTWLWRALIFHLLWLCAVGVVGAASPTFTDPRPFLSGGIFYARPDIDTAILGVTAGLLLRRLLLGQRRGWAVVGLVATSFAASSFVTRAGFIALGLCCTAAFAYAYVASGRQGLRRVGMILVVPLVLLGVAVALPNTTVGGRLIATVDSSDATQASAQNAVGTEKARKLTWAGVTKWTLEDRSRATFGGGMGVDFLAASDTLQYLEGTDYENVRSPHDYFIGSMARLGLVGLSLIGLVILRLLGRMFKFRKQIAEDELMIFAALAVIGIVSVASLGVVLEAPFGAVPFWWSAGILLALSRVKPVAA